MKLHALTLALTCTFFSGLFAGDQAQQRAQAYKKKLDQKFLKLLEQHKVMCDDYAACAEETHAQIGNTKKKVTLSGELARAIKPNIQFLEERCLAMETGIGSINLFRQRESIARRLEKLNNNSAAYTVLAWDAQLNKIFIENVIRISAKCTYTAIGNIQEHIQELRTITPGIEKIHAQACKLTQQQR